MTCHDAPGAPSVPADASIDGGRRGAAPARALPRADLAYAVALASLPGMGPASLRALIADRSPASCWDEVRRGVLQPPSAGSRAQLSFRRRAAAWREAAQSVSPADALERCDALGIAVHVIGQPSYPSVLLADPSPPAVCFTIGERAAEAGAAGTPRVAVVGTRSCTHYGEEVAAELGAGLAARGVSVVSGLAPGIDAAAHEGALVHAAIAPPIAILGCGVDVVYPASNRRLRSRVASDGVLLAESPPGTPPERWRFPARNRLIAACADVLVVVESHHRGGAMHTVDAAVARGVPVAAVPGSVRSAASRGTNALLADGAAIARDVDDVVALLALRRAGPSGTAGPGCKAVHAASPQRVGAPSLPAPGGSIDGAGRGLDDAEERVRRAVRGGVTTLEVVLARTGLGIGAASLALDRLAGLGLVRRGAAGYEAVDARPVDGSARHAHDG